MGRPVGGGGAEAGGGGVLRFVSGAGWWKCTGCKCSCGLEQRVACVCSRGWWVGVWKFKANKILSFLALCSHWNVTYFATDRNGVTSPLQPALEQNERAQFFLLDLLLTNITALLRGNSFAKLLILKPMSFIVHRKISFLDPKLSDPFPLRNSA